MGKRGAKPKGKVKIRWSPEFAYAIGLLTTDGNLSSDRRHIALVSSDIEQIKNFKKCLNIKNKIGIHRSGISQKHGFKIQFGDILFFNFLESIGLTPRKSLSIGALRIPNRYYFDFLRGHFDGDGTFYAYWDKRWRSSYMFYTEFISASRIHILWLQEEVFKRLRIKGHITKSRNQPCYQLKYAKRDSLRLLRKLYKKPVSICLTRKLLKIQNALAIIGQSI